MRAGPIRCRIGLDVDKEELRNARLALISATRIVIANGLGILGVSAPDAM